jgi:ribonucleoside-diphosphate reductase alpha chain
MNGRHSAPAAFIVLPARFSLDPVDAIYAKYTDIALHSKYGGGIGIAYRRVRSRGSLIRATNGKSNGITPLLKALDSYVVAVNQGGKRKGACCV